MDVINAQSFDDQIFTRYETQQKRDNYGNHVMFDPLTNFKDLNHEKMDNHLTQEQYHNITPWRALSEIIAIPVVMMTFIVAVKINIVIKLILLFMIVVHIIISTCLVSYLSKGGGGGTNANATIRNDILGKN